MTCLTRYRQHYAMLIWLLATALLAVAGQTQTPSGVTAPASPLSSFNYTPLIDTRDYQLYQWPVNIPKVIALRNNVAILLDTVASPPQITIVTDIRANIITKIPFDANTFPNLLVGSSVQSCLLLPWNRMTSPNTLERGWRAVVLTSKGQIYHNFPSRGVTNDGTAVVGDVTRFEESAVWDLPERRFPANDQNATGMEYYFPCLPADAYIYHPASNTSPAFQNPYGNGGFGKSITRIVAGKPVTFPRYYFPSRTQACNPFATMGGYDPGDPVTILATYQSNLEPGCRICVFMTDDGGRNWFNKYEFTGVERAGNWGNDIDTSLLPTAYPAQTLSLRQRQLVLPSAANPNPSTKFNWGTIIPIDSISRTKPAVVVTTTPHNMATGNIIAIQDSGAVSACGPGWSWMTNDSASPTSGGNGVLFRVEVVDTLTLKLHEFVHSPFNNIPCRHVHHINRVKDGWIIGTGEEYPCGWLFLMKTVDANAVPLISAADTYPMFRLNSRSTSVQRTLGAVFTDDTQQSLIVAEDSAAIARLPVVMPPGRTASFTRNSTGIYTGRVADVDDFSKFTVILETQEPAFFFQKVYDSLIFSGQRGEFAISFDQGQSWSHRQLDATFPYYYGKSDRLFAAGGILCYLKHAAPLISASLTMQPVNTAAINTPVVLSAKTVGGTAVEYAFRVGYKDIWGRWYWQMVRDYSQDPVCIWTPTVARTYNLEVWAREIGSTTNPRITGVANYSLK